MLFLGINVEPDKNAMGLTIKSVAAGGAVYKENQPQVNDVLYSINDDICTEMTLTQARTLIRHHSLRSSVLVELLRTPTHSPV